VSIACSPNASVHSDALRREYNDFVASVAGEVAALKEVQAAAIAEQMALDEASLERLKAEEAKAKVRRSWQPLGLNCDLHEAGNHGRAGWRKCHVRRLHGRAMQSYIGSYWCLHEVALPGVTTTVLPSQ
jgi:hypothetical protein